jgi:hypothetical protein
MQLHGTGTPLGDPIEVGAAAAVYLARGGAMPMVLASSKTLHGHAEPAAGTLSTLMLCVMLCTNFRGARFSFGPAGRLQADRMGTAVSRHHSLLPWHVRMLPTFPL